MGFHHFCAWSGKLRVCNASYICVYNEKITFLKISLVHFSIHCSLTIVKQVNEQYFDNLSYVMVNEKKRITKSFSNQLDFVVREHGVITD